MKPCLTHTAACLAVCSPGWPVPIVPCLRRRQAQSQHGPARGPVGPDACAFLLLLPLLPPLLPLLLQWVTTSEVFYIDLRLGFGAVWTQVGR
jgi:hypothetical protein